MSEMSQVVDLLARTDRQFEHTQHRLRRTKVLLYVILGPLYALALGFAVSMLIRLWQGEEAFQFWISLLFSANFALHIVRAFVSFDSDSRAPLFAPVAALREAIRTGDTTLVPIVTDDAALAPDPSPIVTNRIGPLRRPMKWSNPFLVLSSILLLVAITAVPLLLAYINTRAGVSLAVALLLPATVSCLLAYRAIGPVHVRVDAEGLRWPRLLSGYHRLAWRDAQALIQLGDVRMFIDDRKMTFIIYSTARVFTWNITGSSRRQQERAATQSLLHTISQHIGLPLRDVSTEARRIAYQVKDPLVAHKLTSQERTYRFRVAGIVLLPFIIIGLFAGTLQITQPWYFEHLYAQSHASTPLYADTLTHPDGDWPVTVTASFVNGTYTITHDDFAYPSVILAPRHVDNALYEVTVRPSGDSDAGVAILGGDDLSQPMLTFHAAPAGGWRLGQMSLGLWWDNGNSFYRIGDSAVIHQGIGMPNRIAVLVQGSDFIFFVNGHYMTRYHDDHLAGGHAGLYLDPQAGQGSFTDFAIYPV